MNTHQPQTGASRLSILVETDFDRIFLLSKIEQEPDEPLYRAVYKALYLSEPAASDHTQNIRPGSA